MPAYLVELPESHRFAGLVGAQDKLVVFAADVAGAREAAEGHADGDGNVLWSSLATVTEIVVGTLLSHSGLGWEAFVRLSGAAAQTADMLVQVRQADIQTGRISVGAGIINGAGNATYVVDEILTAAGGTVAPGGRAATFRITAVTTGTIDSVEMMDPGEYTVAPTPLTANPVTGGGGDSATVDITTAEFAGYEAILARLVSKINDNVDIANAAVDFSEAAGGARLFTVSSIADDVGDGTLVFEMRRNGSAFSPMVSTIVHEGIAAAVITAAIPASPIAPPRVTGVKS